MAVSSRGWKQCLIKIMVGISTKRAKLNDSPFPLIANNTFLIRLVMKVGWKCHLLCPLQMFVALSAPRQLLPCGSLQPGHYSSFLFHVVHVSGLNGDYSLTLMIFVLAIQQLYKG